MKIVIIKFTPFTTIIPQIHSQVFKNMMVIIYCIEHDLSHTYLAQKSHCRALAEYNRGKITQTSVTRIRQIVNRCTRRFSFDRVRGARHMPSRLRSYCYPLPSVELVLSSIIPAGAFFKQWSPIGTVSAWCECRKGSAHPTSDQAAHLVWSCRWSETVIEYFVSE